MNVSQHTIFNYFNKLSITACQPIWTVLYFSHKPIIHREVYPVAKPVQPQLILEVIVQALSVSSSVNTDAAEAASVKKQALRSLDAMILW